MPNYYLHITNGHIETEDNEGQFFDGIEAARDAALRSIRSLVSDDAQHGKINLNGKIAIMDADTDVLTLVRFRDAFEITGLEADGKTLSIK